MTMSIQQAIDTIISAVPGAPFAETVDTVKVGNTSQPLMGIVVCFLANAQIIEQAAQQGANLIIAHEPLFYNHLDKTDWLETDVVYHSKRDLLMKHKLVVWRFHDYLHSIPPDATVMGIMREMGWQSRGAGDDLVFTDISPMPLQAVAQLLQQKLGLQTIRIVGDMSMPCKTVAIMPGSPPAQYHIEVLHDADVLIAGEINEWETNEYVRDANLLGQKKGLIVIGHAASEEPGMRLMTDWLQERLPGVPIKFIPAINPFHYI
jgi:putative NIF3 family GTP cyclohydrolase 1 type 2